jgi:transposase-like protein
MLNKEANKVIDTLYQLADQGKTESIKIDNDPTLRNASEKWTMPIKNWGLALNQFAIEFGKERVPF